MVRRKREEPPQSPSDISLEEEEEELTVAPHPDKYPAQPPLPFLQKPGEDAGDIRVWLQSFDIYLQMIEDNNQGRRMPDRVKNNYLCTNLGPEGLRTFAQVPGFTEKNTMSHEQFRKLAVQHFGVLVTKFKARFDFFKRQQETTESIHQFETALRTMLNDCAFPPEWQDELLMTQLINGTSEAQAQKELLAMEHQDLAGALRTLRAHETARKEIITIKPATTIAATTSRGKRGQRHPGFRTGAQSASSNQCNSCGSVQHRTRDQNCLAIGQTCSRCGRIGHFARVCMAPTVTRGAFRGRGQGFRRTGPINRGQRGIGRGGAAMVTTDEATIGEVVTDKGQALFKTFWISNGRQFSPVELQVDTGAEVSIVGEEIYKEILDPLPIEPPRRRLKTVAGTSLAIVGEVKTKLQFGARMCTGKINIARSPNIRILGNDFLKALNVQINCGTGQVYAIKTEGFKQEFPKLFSDTMGTYKGKPHHIRIAKDAVPRAVRLRPIPLARREQVLEEIQEMDKAGIWEEVLQSEWVHPMVTVPKSDGRMRITTDLTALNHHVIPERFPLPRIKDLFVNLAGSKIFSKLDLRKGYFHIPLDESSRDLTTTITPLGLRRYMRLPMGLTDAASAFQRRVQQTMAGLEGVEVYIDDIIVHWKDVEEHDRRLRQALSRLQTADFRLQIKKVVLGASSIPAFGHIISSGGMRPDPKNIEPIVQAPRPTDVKGVQRFLGMINYYQDYLRDIAPILEPLRKLIRQEASFKWQEEEELSFQTLKKMLTEQVQLHVYNREAETILTTDASDVGLGAVLSQIQGNKEVPIAFYNKTLGPAERNYAVNEKEAYACMMAMEHWESLLLGKPFTLRTDHQALKTLMTSAAPKRQSAKFLRWRERLSAFNYKVEYVAGHTNKVADYLSRLRQRSNKLGVMEPLVLALKVEDYRQEMEKDPCLVRLREILRTTPERLQATEWDKVKDNHILLPYKRVRSQLEVKQDLIFKGEKVVVPEALRGRVLEEVHTGHPGINRMKAALRVAFWWPGIDKVAEEKCKTCDPCQQSAKSTAPRKIPKMLISRPEEPGAQYALDISGPFFNGRLLVALIDYASRFPEVLDTTDTTSGRIIKWLAETFDRYGNPQGIVTDNGPQFVSEEFERFLEDRGIYHYTASVYNPQENGLVEVFNKYLKNGIQAYTAAGTPWNQGLRELLTGYRAYPQETGMSPGEKFFGRSYRPKWIPNFTTPRRRVTRGCQSPYQPPMCTRFSRGDVVRTKLPQVVKGKSPFSEPKVVTQVLGRFTYRLSDGQIWNARRIKACGRSSLS